MAFTNLEQWLPIYAIIADISALSLFLASSYIGFTSLRDYREDDYKQGSLYSDEDGTATSQSTVTYKANLQRGFLSYTWLLGLLTELYTLSIKLDGTGAFKVESWLTLFAWTSLSVQATFFSSETLCIKRFHRATCVAVTATIILAGVSFKAILLSRTGLQAENWSNQLLTIQALSAISTIIHFTSIPRRPNVYHQGKLVSPRKSVSLWERYTFSWVEPIVQLSAQGNELDAADLPVVEYTLRSKTLLNSAQKSDNKSLWRRLFKSHIAIFMAQVILQSLHSIVSFIPSFAIYNILQQLQGNSRLAESGVWIGILAIGLLAKNYLKMWVMWISFGRLEPAIQAQFSALIYHKVLKVKDIKEPKSMDEEDGPQFAVGYMPGHSARIAYFCANLASTPGLLISIAIASWSLTKLVGWQSVTIALIITTMMIPFKLQYGKKEIEARANLVTKKETGANAMKEVIDGIRQIKFSAMEDYWQQRLDRHRKAELKAIWQVLMADMLSEGFWICVPVMSMAALIISYALQNGGIPASIAFAATHLFDELIDDISELPQTWIYAKKTLQSIQIVNDFLDMPEKPLKTDHSDSVVFTNAYISWPSNAKFQKPDCVLRNVNLEIPAHGLTIISGRVGSGKSLLLASIIGEADIVSGHVKIPKALKHPLVEKGDGWIRPSSLAFVPQNPWLENATIQDNILFGCPYDADRFQQVVAGCALIEDVKILQDGLQTKIGPSGINLSGGQRFRVSLARALYSRAELLVMDDVFSAVDVHVGKRLLQTLTGPLGRDRTKIMATHHIDLCLQHAELLVELTDGTAKSVSLSNYHEPQTLQSLAPRKITNSNGTADVREAMRLKNQSYDRKEGKISLDPKAPVTMYSEYIRLTGGPLFWIAVIFTYATDRAVDMGQSWWLAQSPESQSTVSSSLFRDLSTYLLRYGGLSATACFSGLFKKYWLYRGSIAASTKLHASFVHNLLYRPLRWFDLVPMGRILGRYVDDFELIDSSVALRIAGFLSITLKFSSTIISGLLAAPRISILIIPLFSVALYYARQSLPVLKRLDRLKTSAEAPVLDLFGSTMAGISSLRAYDRTEDYSDQLFDRLDERTTVSLHFSSTRIWLGFRLHLLGCLFTTAAATLILNANGFSSPFAVFALKYTPSFGNALRFSIMSFGNMQRSLTSVERIQAYIDIPTESQEGDDVPHSWPHSGIIEFLDISTRYDKDLPLILKGFSFTTKEHERVGVIGRTGAGKSSLILALFRLLELHDGKISIDGVDISKVKIHELRSRLAIIPQDPTLFSGTIRDNLDPKHEHPDSELIRVLQQVQLHKSQANNAKNNKQSLTLEAQVSQSGHNFSQGERQLLCLARLLLEHPKIMVLDEATSAIDLSTDDMIQSALRDSFSETTVIVIAHRLSTIVDFDRIVVMEDGRAIEIGTPSELIDKKGAFWRMIQESEEREILERRIGFDKQ
jgi:ABC-type multidrug transport system fused ATPase/permease subunit